MFVRQTIILNKFNGGLCDHQDPRDLEIIELSNGVDISVDSDGEITRCGFFEKFSTLTNVTTTPSSIQAGYGLFTFSADYTSTGGYTNTDYYAIAYTRTSGTATFKEVVIAERDGTKWNSTGGDSWISMTTGSDTTPFYPVFYYVDGALRICDGNLDSTKSVNKWFGFINRTHFNDSTSPETYTGWYAKDNILTKPTSMICWAHLFGTCQAGGSATVLETDAISPWLAAGLVGHTAAQIAINKSAQITARTDDDTLQTETLDGVWTSGEGFEIYPPAGQGFNIDVNLQSSIGEFEASTVAFALSYIYDGNQESDLYEQKSTTTGAYLTIPITADDAFNFAIFAQGPYNERLTGARLYMREEGSRDSWYLALDISLKDGIRTSLTYDYTPWEHEFDNLYKVRSSAEEVKLRNWNAETYGSLTGRSDNMKSDFKYKTVVIANRTAYYGNILYDSEKFDDAVYKSIPNAFDVVTNERELTVAKNDGERIIKLESFADRILEFKERHLYIINTAQDIEFLEDEYDFKGILSPAHVIKTEYGVIWFNNYGVYLYNGEKVIDLFYDYKDMSRRKISLSTFQSFLGSNPIIGYDANTKKVYIASEAILASATKTDIYIFNVENQTWFKSSNNLGDGTTSSTFSNMISWFNGDVVIYNSNNSDMYYLKENSTITSTGLSITTADIDFKYPGLKKNIYKVFITHKGSGIKAEYKKNGDTAVYQYTTALLPAATSWITTELTPNILSESKNLYSYKIGFSMSSTASAVSSDFAINDISIVSRIKGHR